MRILVVEDEPDICKAIADALQQEHYVVDTADDGAAALAKVHVEQAYDLLLLDLMLPGINGLQVLRQLRSEGNRTPVLIITARDTVRERVAGLDQGADDYLVKPFAIDEMLARVRALLRRGPVVQQTVLSSGIVSFDPATHLCMVAGKPVPLTVHEERILEYLLCNTGHIVPRGELEDHVWDDQTSLWTDTLKVHISRLRRKLDAAGAPDLIQVVRGIGYSIGIRGKNV
ncbi:MAG: response regulator transcription factor [Candidatus Cryosericum sp.]|nr:response regulator transcription factor [bacterium]